MIAWGSLKEDATLMKGFSYKLVMLVAELHYGFLEVANAAMNELRRLGGCLCVQISPGGSIAKKRAEPHQN